jgi:hypothetical protein
MMLIAIVFLFPGEGFALLPFAFDLIFGFVKDFGISPNYSSMSSTSLSFGFGLGFYY